MKIILLLISLNTLALKSPFPSSIGGIKLPNSHFLDDSEKIIRGMAPNKYINDLLKLGVTDVLIFKNQVRSEVDKEIELLEQNGIENIYQIPFLWHDYPSYEETCAQTIEALKIIREIKQSSSRVLFYHCTVGEDRTGYLSAIWKLISSTESLEDVFQTQMCEKGYARGNPHKPEFVVKEVRNDLTPLFLAMTELVFQGKIRENYLSTRVCKNLNIDFEASTPKCKKQKLD